MVFSCNYSWISDFPPSILCFGIHSVGLMYNISFCDNIPIHLNILLFNKQSHNEHSWICLCQNGRGQIPRSGLSSSGWSVSDSLFVTPWTVASQAPLSMEFSRQENWSGLPFPSARDLSDLRIEPGSPTLAGRFFTVWATREANLR